MRKITSKYAQKKKEKRKQILVSTVLIGILFVSIVGFGFQGNYGEDNKITYNGYEFVNQNTYWVTNIQGVDFLFKYNPLQIQEYTSLLGSLDNYYDKYVYIFSENPTAEIELYSNMRYLSKKLQNACLEGKECPYQNMPTKTCEDNVIILELGKEVGLEKDKNCVYIRGETQEELIKNIDAFLFKLLNIE